MPFLGLSKDLLDAPRTPKLYASAEAVSDVNSLENSQHEPMGVKFNFFKLGGIQLLRIERSASI